MATFWSPALARVASVLAGLRAAVSTQPHAAARTTAAALPSHHTGTGAFKNPWVSFRDPFKLSSVLRVLWATDAMLTAPKASFQPVPPRLDLIHALCATPGARARRRAHAVAASAAGVGAGAGTGTGAGADAGAGGGAGAGAAQRAADGTFEGVQATWVGHATLLVQMAGMTLLTDPVWSQRASAVQFLGPKRAVDPAVRLEDIPHVDAVVISHDHYDHLDAGTVAALLDAHPDLHWFVPLGVKSFMLDAGAHPSCVHELDWWEAATLSVDELGQATVARSGEEDRHSSSTTAGTRTRSLRFVCTPCQHNSGRGSQTSRQTLWASWCVLEDVGGATSGGSGRAAGCSEPGEPGDSPRGARFYFGGDTGYRGVPPKFEDSPEARDRLPCCPVFKDIGAKYGPFDLAALPIGAYQPRWFESHLHADPDDAVCIHRDIRSHRSVGMHWGTFMLSSEDIHEPPRRLATALRQREVDAAEFVCLTHGESMRVALGGSIEPLPPCVASESTSSATGPDADL